jgi:hypothetical protein
MLTTDRTGAYDYEQTEAALEAYGIAQDAADMTPAEVARMIDETRAHWTRVLVSDSSLVDFMRHFDAALRAHGLA